MKINWRTRIASKPFWTAIIPAALILIQALATLVGIQIDISSLEEKLLDVANALFSVLVIMGIVVDPTTAGIGDSTDGNGA